jgi:hypothetical protein
MICWLVAGLLDGLLEKLDSWWLSTGHPLGHSHHSFGLGDGALNPERRVATGERVDPVVRPPGKSAENWQRVAKLRHQLTDFPVGAEQLVGKLAIALEPEQEERCLVRMHQSIFYQNHPLGAVRRYQRCKGLLIHAVSRDRQHTVSTARIVRETRRGGGSTRRRVRRDVTAECDEEVNLPVVAEPELRIQWSERHQTVEQPGARGMQIPATARSDGGPIWREEAEQWLMGWTLGCKPHPLAARVGRLPEAGRTQRGGDGVEHVGDPPPQESLRMLGHAEASDHIKVGHDMHYPGDGEHVQTVRHQDGIAPKIDAEGIRDLAQRQMPFPVPYRHNSLGNHGPKQGPDEVGDPVARQVEASEAGDHGDVDGGSETEALTSENLQQLVKLDEVVMNADPGQRTSSVDYRLQPRLELERFESEITDGLSATVDMEAARYRNPEVNGEVRMSEHESNGDGNHVLLPRPGDRLDEANWLAGATKLGERRGGDDDRLRISGEPAEPERVFNGATHRFHLLHKLDDLGIRGAPYGDFDVTRLDGDAIVTDGLDSRQQLTPRWFLPGPNVQVVDHRYITREGEASVERKVAVHDRRSGLGGKNLAGSHARTATFPATGGGALKLIDDDLRVLDGQRPNLVREFRRNQLRGGWSNEEGIRRDGIAASGASLRWFSCLEQLLGRHTRDTVTLGHPCNRKGQR